MDCSSSGSSVHGIFQARILEWVAFPSLEDLPDTGIKPGPLTSLELRGGFFTTEPPGKLVTLSSGFKHEALRVCGFLFLNPSQAKVECEMCPPHRQRKEDQGTHTVWGYRHICGDERAEPAACHWRAISQILHRFFQQRRSRSCWDPRAGPVLSHATREASLGMSLHYLHRAHLDFIEDFMMESRDGVGNYITYPVVFFPFKKKILLVHLSLRF